MSNLEMTPVRTEEVTAEEYLRIYRADRSNVESVRPLPAALGSKSYGKLVVVYKRPIFRNQVGALGR